jgi:hypothetical protein
MDAASIISHPISGSAEGDEMAKLTKSRGRAPIAQGVLSMSYGTDCVHGNPRPRFTLGLMSETWHRLDLDRDEARAFAIYVAQWLTEQKFDTGTTFARFERREPKAALRALADEIDNEGMPK